MCGYASSLDNLPLLELVVNQGKYPSSTDFGLAVARTTSGLHLRTGRSVAYKSELLDVPV